MKANVMASNLIGDHLQNENESELLVDLIKQSREKFLDHSKNLWKLGSWEYNILTQKTIWSDSLYRLYGINKDQYPEPSYDLFLSLIPENEAELVKEHVNLFFFSGRQ